MGREENESWRPWGVFIHGGASLGLAPGPAAGRKGLRGTKCPEQSRKELPWHGRKQRGSSPPNLAFFWGGHHRGEKKEVPGLSWGPRPDSPAPQLLHGEAEIRDRRELILKQRLHHGGRGGGGRRDQQEAAAVGSARGGIHRSGNGDPAQPSRPVPSTRPPRRFDPNRYPSPALKLAPNRGSANQRAGPRGGRVVFFQTSPPTARAPASRNGGAAGRPRPRRLLGVALDQ